MANMLDITEDGRTNQCWLNLDNVLYFEEETAQGLIPSRGDADVTYVVAYVAVGGPGRILPARFTMEMVLAELEKGSLWLTKKR